MILLLTDSRVFELPGGVANATISLAEWLYRKNFDITIMGSGFVRVKTKHISKIKKKQEKKTEKIKIMVLNPPYVIFMLSRLFLSLFWMLKIFSMNLKKPIKLIHAQDTGYSGLAAVISGKILKIRAEK